MLCISLPPLLVRLKTSVVVSPIFNEFGVTEIKSKTVKSSTFTIAVCLISTPGEYSILKTT